MKISHIRETPSPFQYLVSQQPNPSLSFTMRQTHAWLLTASIHNNWLIISLKDFCIVIRKWPTFWPSNSYIFNFLQDIGAPPPLPAIKIVSIVASVEGWGAKILQKIMAPPWFWFINQQDSLTNMFADVLA